MLKRLKFLLLGVVIGGVFGLWFGVNLGKGQPLYANPFREPDVTERIKSDMEEAYRDTKRSLRDALD